MKKYVHPQDRNKRAEVALLKDVQLLHDRMKRFDDKHWQQFEVWERKALIEATALVSKIQENRIPRKPSDFV